MTTRRYDRLSQIRKVKLSSVVRCVQKTLLLVFWKATTIWPVRFCLPAAKRPENQAGFWAEGKERMKRDEEKHQGRRREGEMEGEKRRRTREGGANNS